MMVAAHPAILPAPLHYRQMEMIKSTNGRSYDSNTQVDSNIKLNWWIHYASSCNGCLQITQCDLTIKLDALTGAFKLDQWWCSTTVLTRQWHRPLSPILVKKLLLLLLLAIVLDQLQVTLVFLNTEKLELIYLGCLKW